MVDKQKESGLMKRRFYILCFIIVGFLLQLLVHALVEKWYISLLIKDFSTYGLGWSWDTWFSIHSVATVLLTIFGLVFGYWQGRYWWPRLYDGTGKRRQSWGS